MIETKKLKMIERILNKYRNIIKQTLSDRSRPTAMPAAGAASRISHCILKKYRTIYRINKTNKYRTITTFSTHTCHRMAHPCSHATPWARGSQPHDSLFFCSQSFTHSSSTSVPFSRYCCRRIFFGKCVANKPVTNIALICHCAPA